MAIKAHLDQSATSDSESNTSQDPRSAERRGLRLETSGFGVDAEVANVTIHNISAAGLLLETALFLSKGEQLAIELPEAGTVAAVVVWRSERLYGCAFEEAIGPAALAAVQLRGAAPEPVSNKAPAAHAMMAGETLGTRINRLRREAGLTLADVAGALGVSKPTVWAWEKGKARPLPERLDAIAAALNVAPELLAPAPGETGEIGTVIAACRERIAEACGTSPAAIKIMIEL